MFYTFLSKRLIKIFINSMKLIIYSFLVILQIYNEVNADNKNYIKSIKDPDSFILAENGKIAPLLIDKDDFPGVLRIASHLQADFEKVTGKKPRLLNVLSENTEVIIIGTIGKSKFIDELIKREKINKDDLECKNEKFVIQRVKNPFPKIDEALVIAGSDKRGTIYGIYDLSQKIGVSPWHYWADVPAKKSDKLYFVDGKYTDGEPKVKYRGIFINDEAPALSGWAEKKFGTEMFNHKMYEHVFELILRLKGNFLWPAMWGRCFYDDDPENPRLADEMGVVVSTSHHEPMMRAHDEWRRYGKGKWNYEKNDSVLREFWRKGIERMGNYESVVTLAMRGDGDEPMSEDANVSLLQKIVNDQRAILTEVTGKEITEIPQVWALYKEVQDYYDKGMRVPDDVTLLLCDDNWGNIRKLPRLGEELRKGGYGIYYHYDYVGGPRNYKWLNTNQIERVWEQMHLAYEFGVKEIWLVNVGDIKPMEFPIDFFLDFAWNPELWTAERLPEYTRLWAAEQFGEEYAEDISEILEKYTKYNSRRKPELLDKNTYSLVNFREFETVVNEYNEIVDKAKKISAKLPNELKDAFYQLVMHQPEASANLNEMYLAAAKNHLYAKQERAETNFYAERVKELFEKDAEITNYYNNVLAEGKWSHMMDQTHIGYTYWQQPDKNVMPAVKKIQIPEESKLGVMTEGSEKYYPETKILQLPVFDKFNKQNYYIEIFNRGSKTLNYSVKVREPWISIDKSAGSVDFTEKIFVTIDWKNVPQGTQTGVFTIYANEDEVKINVLVNNPVVNVDEIAGCFVESNGYISIEAENYSRAIDSEVFNWQVIPNLGKTSSAVSIFPRNAQPQSAEGKGADLEYDVYFFSKGTFKIKSFLSPTLNFHNNQGLRFAIAVDDNPFKIVNMHENLTMRDWEIWVANNIAVINSEIKIDNPGKHAIKFRIIDPGVVLQKIVVETGESLESYLGAPQSYIKKNTCCSK